jgi:ppGpp synthetase/RelA/SpoT-type nucleotidyltranferase
MPWHACRSLFFLVSLVAVSVNGFTPWMSQGRRPLCYSVRLFSQLEQLTVASSKLPPWLTQHEVATCDDVTQQLEALEQRLHRLGWDDFEVAHILQDIRQIAQGDWSVALGCMDFIHVYMDSLSSELASSIFLSPAVLQASIQHYVQCILVRKSGVLERVKQDVPDFLRHREDLAKDTKSLRLQSKATTEKVDCKAIVPLQYPVRTRTEVEVICMAAARIKRAEILIQSILSPSHTVSDRVQGLLLALTDDFRALMIRCVACLYRLQGMANEETKRLSPQTIRLAKDGLQVYSILAGRLGLPQLKKQIENAAFRVLYRRQYQAVASYYNEVGPLMNTVANYLQKEAIQTLQNDAKLMALVEDLDVETRVKEPLSLWKKLIKKSRGRALVLGDYARVSSIPVVFDDKSTDTQAYPPGLVSSGVFDFVALRVVVRARKWRNDEDGDLIREREKLLCYYVQNRLGALWGVSRAKDYIQFPKPNGYQSLHHTSGIALRGQIHIPFEVQIRSGEMHDAAEHGIASHWCYKLGSSDRAPVTRLLKPCSDKSATATTFSGENEQDSTDQSFVHQKRVPSKSYLDALHLAKKREANVYVFMGSEDESDKFGGLISLPSNACVRDALAVVKVTEPTDDLRDKTIMRNGQRAGLNEPVANGDVLWLKAV